MTPQQIQSKSNLFKLLSDPTRLKILNTLINSKTELSVTEISNSIELSHSATSHQLAKLEIRGVVESVRKGQNICYKLTKSDIVGQISELLK